MGNGVDNIDRKQIRKLSLIYAIIVILVNVVGFLMASSSGLPVNESDDYVGWINFMNEYSVLNVIFSVVSFGVPTICVYRYSKIMIHKKTERIINVPFVYAAFGCLGWVVSFVVELCCLLYAGMKYNIHIREIATVSFLNILQESICIFTLAFLSMNFVHRKWVLPKLFPEGNLNQISTSFKPSVRFLVIVFYLSICIFPVFFLTSTLITLTKVSYLTINPAVFIILAVIILISVVILWTFCDYFTAPLKKLKIGIQKIKAGDYQHRVDIVSNDDFGELADVFNDMTKALDEKNKRIQAIQNSIIKGMAVMVESRDNSTGGHISRTSDCVKVFIDKLVQTEYGKHLTPEFCKAVIKAAPMHDLGKIAVDDAILRKPGKFTDEEYEIMKSHSAAGAQIVERVLAQSDDEQFKQIAVNVAHYHHEKWNGTGYPEKISNEEIPIEARIMALADVFDALVSKRCYKDSFDYDKAFMIIEDSLGSHFDPELGSIFIECRKELEELYDGYKSQDE